jgi:hypothetical protein
VRPAIPKSVADVDAAWMTAALSDQWPGIEVTGISTELLVHGAATKVKLGLSFATPTLGAPPLVWIKAGWEPHSEWLASCSQLYAREAWFYRDLNPQVGMNTPEVFFADFANNGYGVVVMEDLLARGAVLLQCTESAPLERMRRSLTELAKLHARFWQDEFLDGPKLDVPMRADNHTSDWPRSNGPEVMAKFMATERCSQMPAPMRDPLRIDRAFWMHLDDMKSNRPFCVLHGDTHPGNCFLDTDGATGFFDWQTIAKGPWAYDVSYHIVSWLNVEDRRRYERELLEFYLQQLAAFGVVTPPSSAAAWLQYRRYIAYGLHVWITNPSTFQSEANCASMITRFSTAAVDLDFFAAWGV